MLDLGTIPVLYPVGFYVWAMVVIIGYKFLRFWVHA